MDPLLVFTHVRNPADMAVGTCMRDHYHTARTALLAAPIGVSLAAY